jgi:hypothetical protein
MEEIPIMMFFETRRPYRKTGDERPIAGAVGGTTKDACALCGDDIET